MTNKLIAPEWYPETGVATIPQIATTLQDQSQLIVVSGRPSNGLFRSSQRETGQPVQS
jgi:hypothetical protein